MGVVTLDLFPKASLGKIAWVGFSLGFDRFHACGYTRSPDKLPKAAKGKGKGIYATAKLVSATPER